MKAIAFITALLFGFLSLLHFYWVFGGKKGIQQAIPTIDGKPAFSPGKFITLFVALALAACCLIVLILGSSKQINEYYLYFGWALTGIFFLRAIGDFKLVGFFKKIRDSKFAKYDSLFYSPLCLLLSGAFLSLTFNHV